MSSPYLGNVPVAAVIDADKTISTTWQIWLQTLRLNVLPPQTRTVQAVGASPFTFPPVGVSLPQVVVITGGSVSLLEFSLDGQIFDDVGVVAGYFPMAPQAQIRMTFSGTPSVISWTTGSAV